MESRTSHGESSGRILRLTQTSLGESEYRVEIALEGGALRQIASSEFSFRLTPQDQEDIRWYLEDYLVSPKDPGQEIAARTEKRMAEIGTDLFEKIFHHNDDTREIWSAIRNNLNETRVEIITGVEEDTSIPWELMREPKTDTHPALRASAFVRAVNQPAQRPIIPNLDSGPIRILLVICRPSGRDDVPFRSVASRLIRGLDDAAREAFQLEVLRPPTFEALADKLRAAKDSGKPYHVVHFDGHGAFLDVAKMFKNFEDKSNKEAEALLAEILQIDFRRFSLKAIYPENKPREGRRGYLLFDNPKSEYNIRLVDGPELGELLRDSGVSALVLNACRSAHAEAPEEPETALQEEGPRDIHAEVRVYGSLAQEVMDAGLAGTVAMRYSVYVVTAAKFVADLYSALARGQTLGQAVTLGRKQLKADPLREIAYEPIPLQDWCVPLVYEAAPIKLFRERPEDEAVKIELGTEGGAPKDGIDPSLPARPDVGFFGRDETIQALDRAFDTQSVVLLHAFAGSGKTTAAAEFARWYFFTGGVRGAVLFTSFERYKPLAQVLDQLGQIFDPILQEAGLHWSALVDEGQRRNVAMQLLQQIPVLWIWDNVESVTGFPTGTESAWSVDEQRELADFLRDARETRAKFLLTSRRDERAWLGDLPAPISIPPMPMQERVQLTRALAARHGRRLVDVSDWRPLLRFTDGNPLTITVVVGQALRDGIEKREQMESFVEKLRKGEVHLDDDPEQGRSRSLGASLRYGFDNAFIEEERKILALLHLFQGFVDVDVLRTMGHPEREWCLTEIRGLTREAGMVLLDRAAKVGLLTAHGGGGHYSIHPAIPWFFRELFEFHYPDSPDGEFDFPPLINGGQGEFQTAQKAPRAFVEALGGLGNYYHYQYEQGNRDMIGLLTAEEANLLHARRLARANGWWGGVISTMQGLQSLYNHTGRRAEWRRLVEEIVPDFVDPETDGPLPGREENWSIVTQHRVHLAKEERQWEEAARLQRIIVRWDRKRAAPAFSIPADLLDAPQHNNIRSLAVSLQQLGTIQRELGQAECEKSYNESLELSERIGDRALAATCAFNLGRVYSGLLDLRDLNQAEHWYLRSLELRDKHDRLARAGCVGQLGSIAFERFEETRAAVEPENDLLQHLKQALRRYHDALDLLPADAVADLMVTHGQLGIIYGTIRQMGSALHHYSQSIQLAESIGDVYGAAQARFNVAVDLVQVGRFGDALLYARAALRNYETYGDRAAEDTQGTKRLIAQIENLETQGGDRNP